MQTVFGMAVVAAIALFAVSWAQLWVGVRSDLLVLLSAAALGLTTGLYLLAAALLPRGERGLWRVPKVGLASGGPPPARVEVGRLVCLGAGLWFAAGGWPSSPGPSSACPRRACPGTSSGRSWRRSHSAWRSSWSGCDATSAGSTRQRRRPPDDLATGVLWRVFAFCTVVFALLLVASFAILGQQGWPDVLVWAGRAVVAGLLAWLWHASAGQVLREIRRRRAP